MMRPNLATLGTSECYFRVLPSDLNLQRHMTNDRFLQVMELGRIDLLLRNGILQNAISKRWRLLESGAEIRYVRDLRPFEHFRLHTRIIGWDQRYFYIEHRVWNRVGRLVALGTVRTAVVDPRQRSIVAADHVAADHGHSKSPPLPSFIQTWNRVGSETHTVTCATSQGDDVDWQRWGVHPSINDHLPLPEQPTASPDHAI